MVTKSRSKRSSAPGFRGEPSLTSEKALDLARKAGIQREDTSEFLDALCEIADSFLIRQYLRTTETPHAQQRQALEELKSLAWKLSERLEALDHTSRQKLAACYDPKPLEHEADAPADLMEMRRVTGEDIPHDRWLLLRRDTRHVRRVAMAAAVAIHRLTADTKAARGGTVPRVRSLSEAAADLASLWERFTGQVYMTGARNKRSPPSAVFVESALQAMHPEATAASIRTALKSAAAGRPRRSRRRRQTVKPR